VCKQQQNAGAGGEETHRSKQLHQRQALDETGNETRKKIP